MATHFDNLRASCGISVWNTGLALVVLLTAIGLAPRAVAAAPEAGDQQRALIDKLRSDAPEAEKAITCKKLAVVGSKDAVPALAPLLTNPRLTSWARIALEAIPGPEADQALLDAMSKVQGRSLVGVINSLGVRRTAAAVDVLAARLNDGDSEVASASAAALGKIGGEAAIKALRPALASAPAAVRSAVAEGCIVAAERLATEGQQPPAIELFDAVRLADVPKPRVLEATRGAILARKGAGIPLLVEQLRSVDKAKFQLGLMVARQLAGRPISEAVAGEIGKTTPERAALLMLVLKDREDQTASPAVLETARRGTRPLRLAALDVVRRGGDVTCVPTLLEIAADSDPQIAAAAKAALAELPDKNVDAEMVRRLTAADGTSRIVLMQVVGQRRIPATAALAAALKSEDAAVRAVALAALGSTIEISELPILIAQVDGAAHSEDAAAARLALRAAAVRMADQEACAEKLVAAMNGATAAKRIALLEVLGSVGGAKSLSALGTAGKEADPQLQDVATKALGQWMSIDAVPVLLDLANNAPEDKYKVRALRGCLRLARQFTMPDAQRADVCRQALRAASRPAEQKLVLDVLMRYPSVDTLAVMIEAARKDATKDEATRAAAAIAKKLTGQEVDVAQLLAQLQAPVKLEILKADYGAAAGQKDVTETLRRQARDLPLIALPSPSYNVSFGGDPILGTPKQLRVQYRINGVEANASFAENAMILLPMPK